MRLVSLSFLIAGLTLSVSAMDTIYEVAAVPEPGTMMLVGAGIVTAIVYSKKRKSRR